MLNKISVGDFVKHMHYNWHGKLKVTAINFGTHTLETTNGSILYYTEQFLEPWTDIDDKAEMRNSKEELFCNCDYSDREIVESSIQIHRAMEQHEIFRFCRTCKKEAK